MRRTRLASLFALGILTAAIGCAAPASDEGVTSGGEAALTEAKVLTKGISYPSGLTITGTHAYFGSNRFIASGDPDLDQEMAYWEGKFSRVPLAGGKPQTIVEAGPINRVRLKGNKLYYAMSDGCWISRVGTSQAASAPGTTIYDDAECTGEGPGTLAGFEVTDDKLVVIKREGVVLAGNLDGSAMKKVSELKIGDWGDLVESYALAGDAVYVFTPRYLTDKNHQPIPQALYRIALSGGAPKKVLEVASPPTNLTSDGKNLYWTEGGTKVQLLKAGATAPAIVADGLGGIVDLAADGKTLYIADAKRDALYTVADVLGTPKAPKKLALAKGVQTLAVSGKTLYFATHAIDKKKAAGIVGAVALEE